MARPILFDRRRVLLSEENRPNDSILLYNEGDEKISRTGGWHFVARSEWDYDSNARFNRYTTSLYCQQTSQASSWLGIQPNRAIDCSNWEYMTIEMSFESKSSAYDFTLSVTWVNEYFEKALPASFSWNVTPKIRFMDGTEVHAPSGTILNKSTKARYYVPIFKQNGSMLMPAIVMNNGRNASYMRIHKVTLWRQI